jgi:ribA/ribD-fused uncharacterized protein
MKINLNNTYAIVGFSEEYRFLSNFQPAAVMYEGILYPSSEHAYQAAKTLDIPERERMAKIRYAGHAKAEGRKLKKRKDWNAIKYGIMMDVVYDKFTRNIDLKHKLLNTKNILLIEGTDGWDDRDWGVINNGNSLIGNNFLGRTLMAVRDLIVSQEIDNI